MSNKVGVPNLLEDASNGGISTLYIAGLLTWLELSQTPSQVSFLEICIGTEDVDLLKDGLDDSLVSIFIFLEGNLIYT